jgi:S-adenosylmethionine uptake transporter
MAPASILAPFQYVEIVSATILGYVIFNDFPASVQWLGIMIIIGSGVYIFLREQKLEKNTVSELETENTLTAP